MSSNLPALRESLRGRSILLTGATGFLAKVFLERLLRDIPEVGAVYILVRAKSKNRGRDRVEAEIFSSRIFDPLKNSLSRKELNERLERIVHFIAGDTSLPRLGLSPEDQLRLSQNIDFVVNAAASTDFRDPLDKAIATNTFSVANVLDFVKASRKGRLLHISTCYVNERSHDHVPEAASVQPITAKQRLPWLEDDELDLNAVFAQIELCVQGNSADLSRAGQRLADAHGWNNIYTFSKWLGERILIQSQRSIHCTILRPSIIESTYQAPLPGWIEGLKVADPLFYAGGSDLVKFFPGKNSAVMDIIPVDRVSNAMFLSLAELAAQTEPALNFYQVCSSSENPVQLDRVTAIVREAFGKQHLRRSFFISAWLFFPGVLVLNLFLKAAVKITPSLGRAKRDVQRLIYLAQLYQPYTSFSNIFENRKLLSLHSRVAEVDQIAFPVSTAEIDWRTYLGQIHIPGLLKYVIKKPSVRAPLQDAPGASPRPELRQVA